MKTLFRIFLTGIIALLLVGVTGAADTKISGFTAKSNPVADDTTVIVDSSDGTNKKITLGHPLRVTVGTNGNYADLQSAVTAINTTSPYAGEITLLPGTLTTTSIVNIYNDIKLIGSGRNVTNLIFNHNGVGIKFAPGEYWANGHVYSVGDWVISNVGAVQNRYRCTTAGTSGAAEPTWSQTIGTTTADGTDTLVWTCFAVPVQSVSDFSYAIKSTATGNGIVAQNAQDFKWCDVSGTGGNVNVWWLELDAPVRPNIGGFRVSGASNGILIWGSDWTKRPYNFGDGFISKVDMSLSAAGAIGMKFLSSTTGTHIINNMEIEQFSISGTVALIGTFNVGVWIENCGRMSFIHGDIEGINWGVLELSQTGSGTTAMDNRFMGVNFVPSAAQSEAKAYVRGAPLQVDHNTGTATLVIRSSWVAALGLLVDDSLKIIQDDDGIYTRTITHTGIAADTPSAGLTTITLTSNLNHTMTVARTTCLTKGGAFPVRTSFSGTGAPATTSHFMKSYTQLPGYGLVWQDQSALQGIVAQWLAAGKLRLNGGDRNIAAASGIGSLILNVGDGATANPSITPDIATETLGLGNTKGVVVTKMSTSAVTNSSAGTLTLTAGTTTTVSNTSVTANSLIYLTPTNAAATVATLCTYVSAVSANTSFTLTHVGAAGTETYNYWIVN